MSPAFIDTPTIQLLRAAAEGDSQAARDLLPHLYDELRKLAGSWMARQTPGHTLQPTALVHEAYARLVGAGEADWDGRRRCRKAAVHICMLPPAIERLIRLYEAWGKADLAGEWRATLDEFTRSIRVTGLKLLRGPDPRAPNAS